MHGEFRLNHNRRIRISRLLTAFALCTILILGVYAPQANAQETTDPKVVITNVQTENIDKLVPDGDKFKVTVTVTNIGGRAGTSGTYLDFTASDVAFCKALTADALVEVGSSRTFEFDCHTVNPGESAMVIHTRYITKIFPITVHEFPHKLFVEKATITPNPPIAGSTYTLYLTIKNPSDTIDKNRFDFHFFYLSEPKLVQIFGNQDFKLNPGESTTYNLTQDPLPVLKSGPIQLQVNDQYFDWVIPEPTHEFADVIPTLPGAPNIKVTNIEANPTTVKKGDLVTFTVTVTNSGNMAGRLGHLVTVDLSGKNPAGNPYTNLPSFIGEDPYVLAGQGITVPFIWKASTDGDFIAMTKDLPDKKIAILVTLPETQSSTPGGSRLVVKELWIMPRKPKLNDEIEIHAIIANVGNAPSKKDARVDGSGVNFFNRVEDHRWSLTPILMRSMDPGTDIEVVWRHVFSDRPGLWDIRIQGNDVEPATQSFEIQTGSVKDFGTGSEIGSEKITEAQKKTMKEIITKPSQVIEKDKNSLQPTKSKTATNALRNVLKLLKGENTGGSGNTPTIGMDLEPGVEIKSLEETQKEGEQVNPLAGPKEVMSYDDATLDATGTDTSGAGNDELLSIEPCSLNLVNLSKELDSLDTLESQLEENGIDLNQISNDSSATPLKEDLEPFTKASQLLAEAENARSESQKANQEWQDTAVEVAKELSRWSPGIFWGEVLYGTPDFTPEHWKNMQIAIDNNHITTAEIGHLLSKVMIAKMRADEAAAKYKSLEIKASNASADANKILKDIQDDMNAGKRIDPNKIRLVMELDSLAPSLKNLLIDHTAYTEEELIEKINKITQRRLNEYNAQQKHQNNLNEVKDQAINEAESSPKIKDQGPVNKDTKKQAFFKLDQEKDNASKVYHALVRDDLIKEAKHRMNLLGALKKDQPDKFSYNHDEFKNNALSESDNYLNAVRDKMPHPELAARIDEGIYHGVGDTDIKSTIYTIKITGTAAKFSKPDETGEISGFINMDKIQTGDAKNAKFRVLGGEMMISDLSSDKVLELVNIATGNTRIISDADLMTLVINGKGLGNTFETLTMALNTTGDIPSEFGDLVYLNGVTGQNQLSNRWALDVDGVASMDEIVPDEELDAYEDATTSQEVAEDFVFYASSARIFYLDDIPTSDEELFGDIGVQIDELQTIPISDDSEKSYDEQVNKKDCVKDSELDDDLRQLIDKFGSSPDSLRTIEKLKGDEGDKLQREFESLDKDAKEKEKTAQNSAPPDAKRDLEKANADLAAAKKAATDAEEFGVESKNNLNQKEKEKNTRSNLSSVTKGKPQPKPGEIIHERDKDGKPLRPRMPVDDPTTLIDDIKIRQERLEWDHNAGKYTRDYYEREKAQLAKDMNDAEKKEAKEKADKEKQNKPDPKKSKRLEETRQKAIEEYGKEHKMHEAHPDFSDTELAKATLYRPVGPGAKPGDQEYSDAQSDATVADLLIQKAKKDVKEAQRAKDRATENLEKQLDPKLKQERDDAREKADRKKALLEKINVERRTIGKMLQRVPK